MKTLNYKLLLAIVLLIPIGLVLKKMINPSGKTIFDLDQKSEPVIVIKPESDLILIDDRHVEDLGAIFTDIRYYRLPNPSFAITHRESASQFRLLHHFHTGGHISLSRLYDELSVIQVNESGETDHLLNLSKVDNWSVEDVDFLPFQVLQDGRILLGNTSTQMIHIIDLKSEEVESKHANLYFTDFAYFEKEDVYVLYSPMPFSDPNALEELGYDIYFLDGDMNLTHFIQPSEATHPLLEVGSDRGFSIPEFTSEYIFWMQYTEGKIFKIYPNGEIIPFIQIEQSAENLLAIERIIENRYSRYTGALPVRSQDENVLKYIPFSDIHFIEDAVLFSTYQGDKPIFIYCDLNQPEKLYAFSKCISLQDFGDRFDFAFVYPNFDIRNGYFSVVFDKRTLSVTLEHIDDRFISHLDGLLSPDGQLLMKYKLDYAFLEEYADIYHR